MRTHYKNGDELDRSNGGCDQCEAAMINGVFCHETGCPNSWKDQAKACFECGCDFYPTSRFERVCEDCTRSMNEEFDV